MAAALSARKGFAVHGCLLESQGKSILFVGPSGAGKSTIAKNSIGATVVSDEMCAVRRQDGCWYAYGLPFLNRNHIVSPPIKTQLINTYAIHKGATKKIISTLSKRDIQYLISEFIVPCGFEGPGSSVYETMFSFIGEIQPSRLIFNKYFNASSLFQEIL